MLPTIELSHPAWEAPLRLVRDAIGWTLSIESGTAEFDAAPALAVGTPQIDDSGRSTVAVQIGDPYGDIAALLALAVGAPERVMVKLRWYDDDGALILGPSILYLHEPVPEGPVITAEARSRSDADLAAHANHFTLENTPTLRGLR